MNMNGQTGRPSGCRSAKEISGKDGAALLSDAGYEGEINWTLDDVNHLFNAIFEGSGQKK